MSKKHLIDIIKKVAQELEDAPGVGIPAPSAPRTDRPARSIDTDPYPRAGGESGSAEMQPTAPTAGQPSSPDVAKMQQELQGLARDMSSQVNLEQLAGPNKQLGGDATAEQKAAAGRMSFADFVTQHYTRDSDISGIEFDWDPRKTEMSEKSPSRPTHTNVVMDTMTRVGNPKSGEFKIDGVWGPRTNAALRNAYALGFGLLEMAKDFHYQPRSFNVQALQQLKEKVPAFYTEIPAQERNTRAKDIVQYLVGIRRLFHEVEDHIFNKTTFSPYIEGSQAYATYSPGTAPDPKMIDALTKKFTNMRVMGTVQGRSVAFPISVSDLVSTQALADWQKKNLPNTPLPNILNQLKQQLSGIDTGRAS